MALSSVRITINQKRKCQTVKLYRRKRKYDKRRIETLPNDLKMNSYILHRAFAYPLWIGGCCFDGIMQMKNVGLNVGI